MCFFLGNNGHAGSPARAFWVGNALRRAYDGTRKTLQRAGRVVNLLALYLVLVFGFLGAPGEWVVWAWTLARAFNSHAPEDPDWKDDPLFFCHFLVDDQFLVEPDLGRIGSDQ